MSASPQQPCQLTRLFKDPQRQRSLHPPSDELTSPFTKLTSPFRLLTSPVRKLPRVGAPPSLACTHQITFPSIHSSLLIRIYGCAALSDRATRPNRPALELLPPPSTLLDPHPCTVSVDPSHTLEYALRSGANLPLRSVFQASCSNTSPCHPTPQLPSPTEGRSFPSSPSLRSTSSSSSSVRRTACPTVRSPLDTRPSTNS